MKNSAEINEIKSSLYLGNTCRNRKRNLGGKQSEIIAVPAERKVESPVYF